MAQLSEIQSAQRNLEESFTKKMDELQGQLQSAGTAKDTVAKVADEFRTFRELIYSVLGLLRQQINECLRNIDVMDSRQRRKTLIFSGIPEEVREDCSSVILGLIADKMPIKDVSRNSIRICHRLGSTKSTPLASTHHRPILVKFASLDTKSAVWRAKTSLKGSSVSVKEYLTRSRQAIFIKARLHFGMRGCWTQDGIIVIKVSDGTRYKITTMEELLPLLEKYPKNATTANKGSLRK